MFDYSVEYVDQFSDEYPLPRNEQNDCLCRGYIHSSTIFSNSCERNCNTCRSLHISFNLFERGSSDEGDAVEDVGGVSNLLVINE